MNILAVGGAGYIGSHTARAELGRTPRFAAFETIIAHDWAFDLRRWEHP